MQQNLSLGVDAEDARRITRRYPEGATVPVRHHPQRPAEAYLESGMGDVRGVALGVAAFVLFAFVAALLLLQP